MALLPEFDLNAALTCKPSGSERRGATTPGTDGTQRTGPRQVFRSADIIWISAAAAASIEPVSGRAAS
jgi:hypothetical protein